MIEPQIGMVQESAAQARAAEVRGLARRGQDPAKAAEVAENFEAFFVKQLLAEMRKSIPESGFLDGGNAEKIYRDMLDQEYAGEMAQRRHLGIASMVEDFIKNASQSQPRQPDAAKGLQAYQAAALPGSPKR